MSAHYIYRITNTINGKFYIGQTNNPKRRWKEHRSEANNDRKQGDFPIYNAMRKYGIDNFTFEIIDECQSLQETNISETWNIMVHLSLTTENGYNIHEGGNVHHASLETKKKLSASHQGQVPWNKDIPMTEEVKRKVSESKRGNSIPWNKGKENSFETRMKISQSNKGRKVWNDGKNISGMSGKAQSDEHKSKIGFANSIKFTPEQIMAIKADERPLKLIAADYGVSTIPIKRIKMNS